MIQDPDPVGPITHQLMDQGAGTASLIARRTAAALLDLLKGPRTAHSNSQYPDRCYSEAHDPIFYLLSPFFGPGSSLQDEIKAFCEGLECQADQLCHNSSAVKLPEASKATAPKCDADAEVWMISENIRRYVAGVKESQRKELEHLLKDPGEEKRRRKRLRDSYKSYLKDSKRRKVEKASGEVVRQDGTAAAA